MNEFEDYSVNVTCVSLSHSSDRVYQCDSMDNRAAESNGFVETFKKDHPPGEVRYLAITLENAERYLLLCNKFCCQTFVEESILWPM